MEPEPKKPKLEDESGDKFSEEDSTNCKPLQDNVTDIDRSTPNSSSNDTLKETSQNAEHSEKITESSAAEIPEQQVDEPGVEKTEEIDILGNNEAVCREIDVGITEYVSQHEGFTGIIKQRFSDFLVNEIDEKGTIVRITDKGLPACDKVEPTDSSVIPETVMSQLLELEKGDIKQVEWKIMVDSKQHRSDIHKAIHESFSSLNSSTNEKEDGKYIRVLKAETNKGGGRRRGERQSWYHSGPFCQFVLYKENKDTADALHVISSYLQLKSKAFTFSGTKDKRAKTSQLITIQKVEAKRLQAVNDKLINMAMGNFSYVSKPLKLGDLKGNHFTIVLRNVTGSDDQLDQAMTSLANIGFINYFGMQRFGTTSVSTHSVGRAMLQQKFSEAIELILKPREGDNSSINAARQHWWSTRDAKEALRKMGTRKCLDRFLLQGLMKRDKNDFVGALSELPRNTRLMYIHSYQSYVWNLMVSSRIRCYGFKPVIGDLVLVEEGDVSKKTHQKVEEITEATIEKYSIHDIVMPLPGHMIRYPGNQLAEEYQEVLEKDQLEGGLRSNVRDYSLPGNYRKMMAKPTNVKWETCLYDDPTVELVLSDGEALNGKTLQRRASEGKYKAAIVEFTLSSSTYATMALREILKHDTSAASMTQLNVT